MHFLAPELHNDMSDSKSYLNFKADVCLKHVVRPHLKAIVQTLLDDPTSIHSFVYFVFSNQSSQIDVEHTQRIFCFFVFVSQDPKLIIFTTSKKTTLFYTVLHITAVGRKPRIYFINPCYWSPFTSVCGFYKYLTNEKYYKELVALSV